MKGRKSSIWNYIIIGTFTLAAIVLITLLFSRKTLERFSNTAPQGTLEYFYMPSCPHCKDFNPTWEELEQKVTQEDVAVRLQKSDIAKDTEKAQKYNVNAAPTVLLIKDDGDVEEYKGPREVNAIMSFIKDKLA